MTQVTKIILVIYFYVRSCIYYTMKLGNNIGQVVRDRTAVVREVNLSSHLERASLSNKAVRGCTL
jgi:hypothetical protein